MLTSPACVGHALMIIPWIRRTTIMTAANTNPRSNQFLMSLERSEYRQ
jgi:hypothetical protein